MFRCLRWDFFLPRFVCEEAGLERVWVVLVVVVVGVGVGGRLLASGLWEAARSASLTHSPGNQ